MSALARRHGYLETPNTEGWLPSGVEARAISPLSSPASLSADLPEGVWCTGSLRALGCVLEQSYETPEGVKEKARCPYPEA